MSYQIESALFKSYYVDNFRNTSLKNFRFSSEEAIEDDYLNIIENDIYESEMSEKHLANESVNEEPMIYIDLVTMLPMPPNRRQGKLERRQSVRNPILVQIWKL